MKQSLSPLLFILLLSLSVKCFSQFKGKIISSETGEPVSFATIKVDSSMQVILSGTDGKFEIPGQDKSEIKINISHLGFKSASFKLEKSQFNLVPMETDYTLLGEVEVTATRFTGSLRSSAGSITLIPPVSLNENLSPTLDDILNSSPGVFMSGGTLSTNRLIIRGIGSRNPYGTNRIRIYYDEIPVTAIDGTSSPENFNPDDLERIEILRGPSSALYGAGLGGTIVIKPTYPYGESFKVSMKNELRSWRGYSGSVNASGRKNNTSFLINGRYVTGDGYRQNNEYDRHDFLLSSRQTNEKLTLNFLLKYIDVKAGIPSSLNREDYINNPRKAADSWQEVKGFENYRRAYGAVRLNYDLLNRIRSKSIMFSIIGDTYESRPFNIYDAQQAGVGIRQIFEYELPVVRFEGGFELIEEKNAWDIFETNSGIKGERTNAIDEDRHYFASFLHSQIKLGTRLKIEPAISLTSIRYRLNDVFENDEDLSGDYKYDPVLSPRIGINYRLKSGMSLYSSAGHGFSPPSLEETLLPEGESNTALKPESGWSFDLGVRGMQLNQKLYFDLGLYYLSLKDLLVTKRLSEERFMGINAGKTEHFGIELFLQYKILNTENSGLHKLIFTSSQTFSVNRFLDFTDDENDYSGMELPGIPKYIMTYGLDYIFKAKWSLNLNYKMYGKQFMNDANNETYTGHELLNIKAGYNDLKAGNRLSIDFYAGIRNALNEKYASMILVNAPSFGGSRPRYYYPGNPVNYIAGIKFHFQ